MPPEAVQYHNSDMHAHHFTATSVNASEGRIDVVLPVQAVTSGANPIAVKKGIDKTCDFLIKKLSDNAKPVKGTGDIKASVLVLKGLVNVDPLKSTIHPRWTSAWLQFAKLVPARLFLFNLKNSLPAVLWLAG